MWPCSKFDVCSGSCVQRRWPFVHFMCVILVLVPPPPPSLSLSLSPIHFTLLLFFLVCFLSSPSPHPTLFCLEGWDFFIFFYYTVLSISLIFLLLSDHIYFFLLPPPPGHFSKKKIFSHPPPHLAPQCVSVMVSVFSVHLCCCLLSCLSCQFLCDVSVMFVMPVSL